MNKNEMINTCPTCVKLDHPDEARFCFLCGSQLINSSLGEFYINLKIPEKKILMEQNDIYNFSGFPFFLQKKDNSINLLQSITFHEFPKGHRVKVNLTQKIPMVVETEELIIGDSLIDDLLNQGYVWFHHSEMITRW